MGSRRMVRVSLCEPSQLPTSSSRASQTGRANHRVNALLDWRNLRLPVTASGYVKSTTT